MNFWCKLLLCICFLIFIFIRSEWLLFGNMLMMVIVMFVYLDGLFGSVCRKKWVLVSLLVSLFVKKKNSLMLKKYIVIKVNGMCGLGISMVF